MRRLSRPSRRSIRNAMEFMAGGTAMEHAVKRKTGKQAESLVNKAVQQIARLRGAELRRNRQGMIDMPGGGKLPFGLGTGTLDLVGPIPILITPALLGRTISVYGEIESKTDDGVLAPHQAARIEHLRSMGAISGVAREGEDFDLIVERWRNNAT